MSKDYLYLQGWGEHWQSEALPGALPQGQLSPQRPPHGLYAEQLSGSAFTRPRHLNKRSWLYRILPSAAQGPFEKIEHAGLFLNPSLCASPVQGRWDPLPDPITPTDFIQGWHRFLYHGAPEQQEGAAIYLCAANRSMDHTYFYNADGELLWIPYQGECEILTEFGALFLGPGEIAVIPRGVRFQVILKSAIVKGYLCENYGEPFRLPDLGPIGSNGLANPRDFQIPHARFEDKTGEFFLITKFHHQFFRAPIDHSPLNVVAWHGNYVPYQYALKWFNVINTVSFDHCDPSIFTVLTSPSAFPGIANVDFVIFPPRWMVAEHTFRPPYYHRNIMSEYMGLIEGRYDAKAEGFVPGGSSLHNCMSAHGPDAVTFEKAFTQTLAPEKIDNTMAFMLESRCPWIMTSFAEQAPFRQSNYHACWQGLKKRFTID